MDGHDTDFIGNVLIALSYLLCLLTFPISICFSFAVIREYQRAVVFRIGRLMSGGARGPGKCKRYFEHMISSNCRHCMAKSVYRQVRKSI